jgi:hypothetical protein
MVFTAKALSLVGFVIIALIGLAPQIRAQAVDGNLVGMITDSTGASVPNAAVEITNTTTNLKNTVRTGIEGLYRFNNVPVGLYDILVTARGFAPSNLKGVSVELNKTATANVVVQVRGVTEAIAVLEAPAVIDTTTSQLQSTFKADQIVNLPIIESAGNFFGALNLSLMSAGVASNGGIGQGTGPSVGGQRPTNNNYTIEGVDNNNKTITGPLLYVPTEATQEFSVLQNHYNAEFGHSTGGQFNVALKRGGNSLRGSVYEYFQNRKLDALDQAFKREGVTEQPRYDQNRFGGTIGGPVVENKWFYFGNFEFAPLGRATTVSTPVRAPTAAGFGLLDAMPPLNAAGTAGVSKTNLGVLKQFVPSAPVQDQTTTVSGVAIPIGILPAAGSTYANQYAVVTSSDYDLSDSNRVRFRLVHNRLDQLDSNATLPAFWTKFPQRYSLATGALYHTFSSTWTSETRIGFHRFTQLFAEPDLAFPGLDRFPNITAEGDLGLNLGPDPAAPQSSAQTTYQLVHNMSWNSGHHNVRFGFDGRRAISSEHFIERERGDYIYKSLESYLHDVVPENLAERTFGDATYSGNQWATYFYLQDDWHVTPRLTLNLGARWEFTSVPSGMKRQSLNAISGVPGIVEFLEPKANYKNFAPRVGVAYSPANRSNTSIRAGIGMGYDVIFDNVGITSFPPQLALTVDAEVFPSVFTAPFLAQGGLKPGRIITGPGMSQADARAATSSFIPDQVMPYSIQWTLGLQQQVHNDYTVEVRYVGTRGVHLLVQSDLFQPAPVRRDRTLPTYLTRPAQTTLNALTLTLEQLDLERGLNPVLGPAGFFQPVTWWPPIGNSSYHGLATQITRRFTRGLQFIGAYTWSHNIDDSTVTHFSTFLTPRRPQDFLNMAQERASSALDRRHRLTLSWTYESQWMKGSPAWAIRNLFGNWRWSGFYTYESPEYVTAQSLQDSNLNGDSAPDRTVINPSGDPSKGSGVTPLLNSSGQTVAYLANDPSARYIQAGLGVFPNGGRNTLPARPINNFDMSFGKRFAVREGHTVEFRADFGNIFNHPQYTPGYVNSVRLNNSVVTSRTFLGPQNPDFAKWDQVFNSNARSVQLAVRYVF